jgi:hypothetical protein
MRREGSPGPTILIHFFYHCELKEIGSGDVEVPAIVSTTEVTVWASQLSP